MSRLIVPSACLCALSLVAAAPAVAQEAEDRPGYSHIEAYEVEPAHTPRFLEAVAKAAEAARQASLAPRFGWGLYVRDNTFYVVSNLESMAAFDDPDLWTRQFEGTSGQATLDEAMGLFAEVRMRGEGAVERGVSEWTYTPATPAASLEEHGGVHVIEDVVKFGREEAFGENTKSLLTILEEIAYPYPVLASRTVIGRTGVVSFAVVYDDLASFYGENELEKLLAEAGKAGAWEALVAERRAMVSDVESFTARYLPAHSYRGPAGAGVGGGA